MIKQVLFFFSTILFCSSLKAQTIDTLYIIPTNPTECDSVFLVSKFSTPNASYLFSQTIDTSLTPIHFTNCYCECNGGTFPTTVTDTSLIGILDSGIYSIAFKGILVFVDSIDSCATSPYHQEDTIAFTVSPSAIPCDSIHASTFEQPLIIENLISLYPNPVLDRLHFKNSLSIEPMTVSIYNVLGSPVNTKLVSDDSELDISELKSGIYVCIFSKSTGSIYSAVRFVKQ